MQGMGERCEIGSPNGSLRIAHLPVVRVHALPRLSEKDLSNVLPVGILVIVSAIGICSGSGGGSGRVAALHACKDAVHPLIRSCAHRRVTAAGNSSFSLLRKG